MQPDLLASLRRLSDSDLVGRVQELAARERGATLLLVAHLAELDTRDVHYRAGHGSLFAYCRDVLGLAEQEAYNRIAVARAARRFPVILDLLEAGALHLTSVRLLAPHLTRDNHKSVLESARGKSKAQVEEIAAALWPRPDAPSSVRKLPAPRPTVTREPPVGPALQLTAAAGDAFAAGGAPPSPLASDLSATTTPATPACGRLRAPAAWSAAPGAGSTFPSAMPGAPTGVPGSDPDTSRATPAVPGPPVPGARRSSEVTPLSPDRYRVQVTIGAETLEKLRLAKDLLRHAVPSGDEAVILDRALTALLADIAQRKFAATDRPRPAGSSVPGSRHIPAEVKRRVWLRDLGRCAFLGTNGRRCHERAFLEFHHVTPHALGGEATVANIQLRCRNHNAYEARLYFANGNGGGNGGAGSVREDSSRYGLASREIGPRRAAAPTRSRTSRRSRTTQGPAP